MKNSNYVYFAMHDESKSNRFFQKLEELIASKLQAMQTNSNLYDKSITLFSDTFGIMLVNGEKIEINDGTSTNNIISTFELENLIKEYQKKLDLNSNYEILCFNIMPPYDFFDFKL